MTDSLHFTHEEFRMPRAFDRRWVDVQPALRSAGKWFALLADGCVGCIDFRHGAFELLHATIGVGFGIDDDTALSVSPRQDYAAIYQTSGQLAAVFDLASGNITARIDRQAGHHAKHGRFPIAFVEVDGRTHLVAATDWNRLDLIAPATGAVLTTRDLPSRGDGHTLPPHYLDYFHAQLVPSPQGDWIVDSGWVWGASGIARSWNLRDWLVRNVWESEDGLSVRELTFQESWDAPVCWIDEQTVILAGKGVDDSLIQGARMVDVRDGHEIRWFPGPQTRSRAWNEQKKIPPSLFFDRYLFSVHEEHGTGVWDIETGEHLHTEAGFTPIHYHPVTREFLSLDKAFACISRLVP